MQTLAELSLRLERGQVSARALVEQALRRIEDPGGEGARVFLGVARDSARRQAEEIDRQRAAGHAPSPFAGIPVAIKDLFDVTGEVTRAGSRVLSDRPPASADAPAVARLRAAGFVLIGRTNMTEFAYSGLGLNPHYGTPLNPFDRATGRIPGGSSSGSAVAVTDGMAAVGLGTDTGGSCRIPAAFTGIVGFKPTARRVPTSGTIPLSHTLDSVGPIARSVQCCATVDAILRGAEPRPLPEVSLGGMRLLIPTTLVFDGIDAAVARAFEAAERVLDRAGASIVRAPVSEFAQIPELNAAGGIVAAESYAWHRELIERDSGRYDPRVAVRILKGRALSATAVSEIIDARGRLVESVDRRMEACDALLLPTVPIVAPPLSACALDADYARLNALVLRNPSLANFLDLCGISLPIHESGSAPVGLMLLGRRDGDERLLALARAVESAVSNA